MYIMQNFVFNLWKNIHYDVEYTFYLYTACKTFPKWNFLQETSLYITRTYDLNMGISTFFPWNMVSLGDFLLK